MPENTIRKGTKQIIILGLLFLSCFLLAGILLTLYKNSQNGRYDFFKNESSFYVLDTKTGQVWEHFIFMKEKKAIFFDYGTPKSPTCKIGHITEFKKDEQSLPKGLRE